MSAKIKKIYTAKYDRVFKTIFCDEDNKKSFQEFLTRLLKKKAEIIEFLRNELPVQTTLEKSKNSRCTGKSRWRIYCSPKYLHIRNFIYFSTLCSKKGTKRRNT